MILEFHVADVVDDHKIKMDAMRLKIRKIRKYAMHTEAWYHYAVGSRAICISTPNSNHLLRFAPNLKACSNLPLCR